MGGLDVFAVGVVAALLEISKFAQFMVGHRCDAQQVLGSTSTATGAYDKCFDVSTELTRAPGCSPAAVVSGVGVVLLRKAKAVDLPCQRRGRRRRRASVDLLPMRGHLAVSGDAFSPCVSGLARS